MSYPGCKVLAGRWTDFTTGSVFEDPAKVSIDHLVPLKEAYRSGASSWFTATMVAFGCIRMLNPAWIQVASLSADGTPVSIRA